MKKKTNKSFFKRIKIQKKRILLSHNSLNHFLTKKRKSRKRRLKKYFIFKNVKSKKLYS